MRSSLCLQVEELVLDLGSTKVGADLPVGADDPVAGDDDWQGVGGARRADGPHRLGVVDCGGHRLVAGRLSVADGRKVGQHQAAEAGREAEVELQVEGGEASGEVVLELAGGLVEPPWGAEDPGADLARQVSQDASSPSRSYATRTSPLGVAARSSVPTGVSRVR